MADKSIPPMDSGDYRPYVSDAGNQYRVCYAAQTLVEEVKAAFPETLINADYSGVDGRNVALDVTFETHDLPALATVLRAVEVDPRVDYILQAEGQTLVSFHSSLRTQDLRDPFHISDALAVLGPVQIENMETGSW